MADNRRDTRTQGRFRRTNGDADALQRLARSACLVVGADSAYIAAHDARGGLPPRLVAAHPPAAAGDLLPAAGASSEVRLGEQTVGVIAVVRDDDAREFDSREQAALDDLAVVAAPLIARVRNGSLDTAVAGLVAAIELRDDHAGGHGDAVLELAVNVARQLDFDEDELHDLSYAARLHDVGKLAIDETILQKAGPLSSAEWDVIREHPVAGASVLESIPGLELAAEMVRAHHERWDGAGYPDALSREEIPLGARVLAVCDAYCAMIEQRPYRTQIAPEEALAELQCEAGAHFDPRVVDAFAHVVRG